MSKITGIFIADATWRHKTAANTGSLMRLAVACEQRGIKFVWGPRIGDALIERGRSWLATQFLERPETQGFNVLVSIDDDIEFQPDDVIKAAEAAVEHNAIVMGAYPTREREAIPAWRELTGSPPPNFMPGPTSLHEVMYCTTGLMAVPRTVFEDMARPGQRYVDADGYHELHRATVGVPASQGFIPFYWPVQVAYGDGQFEPLSEDYALCYRARQLGYTCYLDESIILKHEGMVQVTVADIGGIGIHPVPTGDPIIDLLPAQVGMFMDIAPEYAPGLIAGRGPVQALARKYIEWRGANPDAPELDWYLREDTGVAYILELGRWHSSSPSLEQVIDGLAKLCSGKTVLSHGAGIGQFALRAARAGGKVYAWEPNPKMQEFIDYRTKAFMRSAANGGDGEFTTGQVAVVQLDVLRISKYDVIESWHVLEHVDDPGALIDAFREALTDDGLLIMDCDFHKHAENPMHMTLAQFGWESVAHMMREHGFEPAGAFLWKVTR